MKKRKIAVLVGSRNDIAGGQCMAGLQLLQRAVAGEQIEVVGVYIGSIHRNTEWVLALLKELAAREVDVAIVGAGWANHITGTSDAYLRYQISNTRTVVVGVAFNDYESDERTQAAIGSIKHVPGTQVVFDNYVGSDGFERACKFAIAGKLPTITAVAPRATATLTLDEAIAIVNP